MDEGLWEAARCIRPYLDRLIGPGRALSVDGDLARLLTIGSEGEDVEARIRAVLHANPAMKLFLEGVLEDAPTFRPPLLPEQDKDISKLPGDQSPVRADKFRCPEGDYVWYMEEVAVPKKMCPTHQSPLEQA